MFLPNVAIALKRTDWPLLADQKLSLLLAAEENEAINGLVNFLDALQDTAFDDGFPVTFLTEEGEDEELLVR